MEHRRLVVFVLFVAVVFAASARAQEDRDPIPLKDWAVPFEQIRAKVMETQPRLIAERSLHPSLNAVPSAASHFITVVPCRIVDTRLANGTYGGPKLVGGVSRTFNVPAGPCTGIPASAAAYSLNFTVLNGEGSSGFLTAYPTGSTRPTVSTLNFGVGNLVANAGIVPGGTSASIDVYVNYNVDIIIDINGYFVEGVVTNLNPGTGMIGGGTGNVTLGIAPGGVTSTQLASNAVTNGVIADGAISGNKLTDATVNAGKIGSGQVVKNVNSATDSVSIQGGGGTAVTTTGSTITVSSVAAPSGSVILRAPGDTTLIGAGYREVGPSGLEIWDATSTTGAPSARNQHTAVWTGTKMIVWGGLSAAGYDNTGAQYDPVANSWSVTTTTGAPSGRYQHTVVWTGTKMIPWGGVNAAGRENTGAQYDPVANSWSATNTAGAPSARSGHTAVWTGTRMIVWGGASTAGYEGTGAQYDPVGDAWTTTSLSGAPSGRFGPTSVWTGTTMIVWGGVNAAAYQNTGGQYDPALDSWSATSTVGAPPGREFHTAVWTATKMIVWGGFAGGTAYLNTGAQYDPAGNSWSATSTAGAPSARFYHTAVWTGTKMIVWGGFAGGTAYFNTGAQYDSAGNSWSATTTAGAPSTRGYHTAVWTGTRMIVWGGFTGSANENSGGRWSLLSYYIKN